ncbi:DUF1846 domain-containing protein [Patescibacteria group bacterium]|nr:DUF1846 domain-containing protein [Patescibacteria group bacterium]MBU1673216.1 DUF1846 domain-containing protein [Patescibacteria group bacterium]MBU1964026.1 DUF1846 domain-containing protein [Patescibacteria group bacterium]
MPNTEKAGFSTKKYLNAQANSINERLSHFPDRLYLEFGGKLIEDFHASRTLPGYEPNAKVSLLLSLKQNLEIIYCISAKQLHQKKMRGDLNMTYDLATLKALNDLKDFGLPLNCVVINRFDGENEAIIFKKLLERKKIKVYLRNEIENYPNNLNKILSSRGYGKDPHIKTRKKLVVVWGAGPGAGKLSTCLGQIYLDQKTGMNSGYAKFETFPVWDLPLKHPINDAYEAATADLGDYNLVDPFHKKKYNKRAINYNRDVDAFPIIENLIKQMIPQNNFMSSYNSPTDMGVNRISVGIIDDKVCQEAAKKEIIFFLFRYRGEFERGLVDEIVLKRMDNLLKRLKIKETYLKTVPAARKAAREAVSQKGKGESGIHCGAAIELHDGKIIAGKNSELLYAEASAIINAIKDLAGIPDNFELISKQIIQQINAQKDLIGEASKSLTTAEALLALAVSSVSNPLAKKAQQQLKFLNNCYFHSTHTLSKDDENIFRKIGIWVTTDSLEKGT